MAMTDGGGAMTGGSGGGGGDGGGVAQAVIAAATASAATILLLEKAVRSIPVPPVQFAATSVGTSVTSPESQNSTFKEQ